MCAELLVALETRHHDLVVKSPQVWLYTVAERGYLVDLY